ncbi:hypothetical protein N7451_004655 [Penicillium sp. IBT 35674x]|nr:hypothetical protein N7451_004655 [Penicillium sp. IBT 35674x]
MGGLRMLCCTKGDKYDHGQGPPARPAQPRPEKDTQGAPASFKREACSVDVTSGTITPEQPVQGDLIQQTSAQRDLWKEAFDGLDSSQKPYVNPNGLSATAAIDQVIKDTTAKYEQWQKGGLKIRRKDGNDINLRDYAEKILGAAMKASEVISTAVSFDPTGHASSAWTVISFGMSFNLASRMLTKIQIVQNRLDRRDAIFAASEYLAETLSYYTLIDTNYRNQKVGSDHNLDQALLRVYSAVLEFTVEVKKGRNENEAKRTLQSVFALTDQPLQALKDAINSQSAIADKWANLAANLGRSPTRLDVEYPLLGPPKSFAKKRTGDTGLWLLDSPEYNDWKVIPGRLLWLPGISGCGKSVLCSTVIQDIEEDCSLDPSKFLGYWYFQFGVEVTQSGDAMARSLIRQLSRSPLSSELTKLWENHHLRGSQPDSKAVFDLLDNLLSSIDGDIYLIFDALDECPENEETKERGLLLELLESILERHNTKVHVLVTSRPEQDIKERLDRFSKIDLTAYLAEDVKTFVTLCLTKAPLNRWKPDIHQLISDELLESRERRFRWAELQIMALERCRNESQVINALKAIPQTLEDTYRRVLDNIDSDDEKTARDIFVVIFLSPVLFDVQTVASMVELSFPEDIVKICTTSLVTLFNDKVQLAHFSVQEFLIVPEEGRQHHPCQFSTANGHRDLTEKTVDILLRQTAVLTQADAEENTPFLYAAKHWDTHMNAAGGIDQLSPDLQAKINRLFTESDVYLNWIRAAESDAQNNDNEWSKLLTECEPAIHRASMMGLVQAVDCLVTQGANPYQHFVPNSFNWVYKSRSSSFGVAAEKGQLDVLQILLNKRLPLGQHEVQEILDNLDYRKAGKAKLESVLQTLWDLDALKKQPSDVSNEVSERWVIHAMFNKHSGLEIIKEFLDWQPKISVPITDDVLLTAVCWKTDALDLLLERCDVHVSPAVLEKLKNRPFTIGLSRSEGLALLAIKRPDEFPMNKDLFDEFAARLRFETMSSLMQIRKSDLFVTKEILEAAASNPTSGGIFSLLWPHREPGIVVSESMLCIAVANAHHSREIVTFMRQHLKPRMNLSEKTIHELMSTCHEGVLTLELILSLSSSAFSVTEGLTEIICSHKEATDMLGLLATNGFNVPITEDVVSSAASNESQGPAVIKYLAKIHQTTLPVTESALVAAAHNLKQGKEVLAILLKDSSPSILTDMVFEEACQNKRAMILLLDERENDLPIREMILKISDGDHLSRDVLQVLLERNLVTINESIVEMLAINFHALDALLSWKPDSPITEKALIAGAKDIRSMRLMMGVQGGALHVTEEVLVAATQGSMPEGVMEVIKLRQASIDVTERVLTAGIEARSSSLLTLLVEQTSESLITKVLWDHWKDVDVLNVSSRCILLKSFIEKTGSKITDSVLQDWPFDSEKGKNYELDWFVLYGGFELPATQLAAEVLVERCNNEAIEKFWENKQIPVTDHLIEVAEANPFADKEKLKLFLGQKKG